MKRLLLGAVVASVALGAGASAGNAATGAFLCYSKWQIDPGYWPFAEPSASHDNADQLFASGAYWAPYAETTIPTQTKLSDGHYLICNLRPPAAAPANSLQPVTGDYIDDGGLPVSAYGGLTNNKDFPNGPTAGWYPVYQ